MEKNKIENINLHDLVENQDNPRSIEPFAGMPERALRAHPILPALYQPRPWAQLPLFALVQPVHAGGHPDPWLP